MKSGRLEVLLIILIVAGLGYMGLQYFGRPKAPALCAPLTLSPEVKAYIDKKFSAPAQASGDFAVLNARLVEFETKFKALDKDIYLKANQIVEARRIAISAKVREQRRSIAEVSASLREAELGRLRSEAAVVCAGVKTVRSKPAKTSSPEPAADGAEVQTPAPENPPVIEDLSPGGPPVSKDSPGGDSGGK